MLLSRLMTARFALAVVAMMIVVTASNILVQFPVEMRLGSINLADLLTWGAFTYPLAFLVSDLTNRREGPTVARLVVLVGFVLALAISFYLATPRIAIASGSAFLIGQLLDISVFQRLRNWIWYVPPFIASIVGSALDTLIFFSLAFAPMFAGIDLLFGHADGSLGFGAPWLGVGGEVPLWTSLASGDFSVKLLSALVLLVPYRLLMGSLAQRRAAAA
ncbi:VUT family protein [Devosia algicola]|uniref:Probable queuosine precursor transporter n=1 Tax=Devosia algicola TaxID=3026418 RepID=A0ABY7YJJ3_9HYPH|nr:VUT family protein [Devosia algicola]WDR01413.1 VUT family protein [Devosia algicola]